MRTTYRMRAGRFLGVLAAGAIVLGVAAILWALGLPGPVWSVFAVLGAFAALAGVWVLLRPPVLLRLDAEQVEVRGLPVRWTDVTEAGRTATTQGEAVVLRTAQRDGAVLIPLRWLPPAKATRLEQDLRERLNAAHGYTVWDSAAGPTD